MKKGLICTDYEIRRSVGKPVYVNAVFALPFAPYESEKIAEALKAIELLFASSDGIDFVKNSGKSRCVYCGVVASDSDKTCTQCGAPVLVLVSDG